MTDDEDDIFGPSGHVCLDCAACWVPPRPPRMILNPGPLRIVKLARCQNCGRPWGLRGTCVCLVGDPVWPDEEGTPG